MRELFKRINKALGLERYKFVPASLRAGGCTHRYLQGEDVNYLKFAGGWTSIASLEHYIQEAISVRTLLQLEASAQTRLSALLRFLPGGPHPPAKPWFFCFSRPDVRAWCQHP